MNLLKIGVYFTILGVTIYFTGILVSEIKKEIEQAAYEGQTA